MTPRLSVILPTIGQRLDGLARTLDSIDRQPESGQVEVVVVGDAHSGPLPKVRDLVWQRGPRYRYAEHDGGLHMVGQPQRQYGMGLARAPWLSFSADDNIYTEGAFAAILRAIDGVRGPVPLLFQVRTWQAGKVWKRAELAHGDIDADCIVAPNDRSRLGVWTNRYEGDWEFIRDTCEQYDDRQVWVPDLIGLARPTAAECWFAREMATA